jgi:hypothetical protein
VPNLAQIQTAGCNERTLWSNGGNKTDISIERDWHFAWTLEIESLKIAAYVNSFTFFLVTQITNLYSQKI